MGAAWLLTLIAVIGAWAGAHLMKAEKFSEHLAAAGGGLLFGISIFWLVPEIGETSGKPLALTSAITVAIALALLDTALSHSGHSAREGVLWPILAATAVHSFLDGWSVRALAVHPFTDIAVALGLALHKVPEGMALGWISRKSLNSANKAVLASASVEIFTLLGAFAQPGLNASGSARFGSWWTAAVLAVISGGFLFLGFHAVVPHWKKRDVIVVFLATLLLVGALSFS